MFEEMMGRQPVAILSLPLEGNRPWYAQARGENEAIERVVSGAPPRLGPPDQPNGPFASLTDSDEKHRVAIHTPNIVDSCERMLGDPSISPRDQRLLTDNPAVGSDPRTITDLSIESSLLVQAMDPGIGRFLGLVTRLDEIADPRQPVAYAALGLFSFLRDAVTRYGRRLTALLGDQSPVVSQVVERYLEVLDADPVSGRSPGDLRTLVGRLSNSRFLPRGLISVAGAVPAPDRPDIPTPGFGASSWLPGGDEPSMSFRQDFVFSSAPMGALAAMARKEEAEWHTRQRDETGNPAVLPKRACALLMGRTRERYQFLPKGLLSDSPIPAIPPPALYRFSLADLFGRYGSSVDVPVPPPARPAPPPPAPLVEMITDGPVDGPGGPASPGHIKVTVAVPYMMDLAAGSLPITAVSFLFDGLPAATLPVAPEQGFADIASRSNRQMRTVAHTITLPALSVAQSQSAVLSASFVDSAGTRSPDRTVTVAFADRRRPKDIPTGLGLIWTSRPGPSPEVELKLAWPSDPGRRYRAYIADEKSLGLSGPSRAAVAVEGGRRARLGTLGQRDRFRLLTDPPIEEKGGWAGLDERLPRSITGVQFLRVVPLTATGQETPFDSCGVVPIAVPSDRKPPPPRITGHIDPANGSAKLSIEAVGLDLQELTAAEPGLFDNPPAGDAWLPEYRLRRASGPLNDPVYAREVRRGLLTPEQVEGHTVFRAEVPDPSALIPFIRYTYWAEVRLPSERRLARGIVEDQPDKAIAPTEPHGLDDMPRPFSPISAPTPLMLVPDEMPTVPAGATAAIEPADAANVHVKLSLAGIAPAHPKAIAPYRLRIWIKWESEDPILAGDAVAVTVDPFTWLSPPRSIALASAAASLILQLIDPAGRMSSVATVATQA
jgi:hypothetical protein